MYHHPNSKELCNYLIDTSTELIRPIAEIAWNYWEPGDPNVDGRRSLASAFYVFGLQLACADGALSDLETSLLSDVLDAFYVDGDEKRPELPTRELTQIYRQLIRKNPNMFSSVQVPYPVLYLQIYDDKHFTDLAIKAKTMLFRFANAMFKADGKVTESESSVLNDLKEMLFHDPSGPYDDDLHLEDSPNSSSNGVNSNLLPSRDTRHTDESASDNRTASARTLDDLLSELDSLIGPCPRICARGVCLPRLTLWAFGLRT
jgi:uncharacterized tellurite resistance protein B-like protein